LHKHLDELTRVYGSQTFVSLVDQKRHEQPIKEAYDRAMAAVNRPDVRYQYFDFHNECKGMRYERISKLTDLLEEDLARKGWFHYDTSESQPKKIQLGTIRTNCMDNLDRTNVVQTHMARYTLNKQLREIGILTSKEDTIDNYPQFLSAFRTSTSTFRHPKSWFLC
jgi:phosphatidylinositol 4-phosphatase